MTRFSTSNTPRPEESGRTGESRAPLLLPPAPAVTLDTFVQRAGKRDLRGAAELIQQAVAVLADEQNTTVGKSIVRLLEEQAARAWRYGPGLYHLPGAGTAYVMSDLEGKYELAVRILRKLEFVERVVRGEDLYLCILGDMVDRGGGQVPLVELLLDMKIDPVVGPRVLLLAGTHEHDALQNKLVKHNGFFFEVVDNHAAYRDVDFSNSTLDTVVHNYLRHITGEGRPRAEDDRYLWERTTAAAKAGPPLLKLPAWLLKAAGFGSSERADDERERDRMSAGYLARTIIWRSYSWLLGSLPRCIAADNGLFMAHAGVGVHDLFSYQVPGTAPLYLQALADADRRLTDDLVWSVYDPAEPDVDVNPRGPVGVSFGARALDRFLRQIACSLMIRGHQPNPPEGVNEVETGVWWHDKILTVTTRSERGYAAVDLSKPIARAEDVLPPRD